MIWAKEKIKTHNLEFNTKIKKAQKMFLKVTVGYCYFKKQLAKR